ncbi:hypothetical protein ONE63_007031 [Megalurothrips usitatus]|uniref:Macro domain-containing protein n=1 Tax=Megalurothrips usitatus TaxID=439358 RepID=A0AAV7XX50_9NEOP|nr:hypothetical protein ONE63_007031 [Megalurothrips usitatus]
MDQHQSNMDQHQSNPSASGHDPVQQDKTSYDSSGVSGQGPQTRTRYFHSQNRQSGGQHQPWKNRHPSGHQNQSSGGRPSHRQESYESRGWNPRDIRPSKPQNRPPGRPGPPYGKQMDSYGGNSKPNQVECDLSDAVQSLGVSPTNIVKEKNGDLFEMDSEYALAHCVGSDFIMSSGVAVKFRKKFRSVPELLEQNKKPGEVAFINHSGRYVYYLVTKLASTGKPTWENFENSVREWKKLCVDHKIKKVAIPKIGCGRDHLDWNKVQNLLNSQFRDTGIEVTVCVIERESTPERKWSLRLQHAYNKELFELDPRDCALVFIGSKDNFVTPSISRLATKYGLLADYSSKQLSVGKLYHFKNKSANVFGLIVKERHTDPISFCEMSKCFLELRKAVKKEKLWYMGFEAFDDPLFSIVTRKVWTMVIDVFFVEEIEVHICWPENVKEDRWDERETSH